MTNQQREKSSFSSHIVISVTCTKSVNIDKQLWKIRRPPTPKLPTVCKPPVAEAALPAPPAQQKEDAVQNVDPVQQDPPQPAPA